MKIKSFIFLILFAFAYPNLSFGQTTSDELSVLSEDTAFVQQITYNTKTFDKLKQDKIYDYSRNQIEDGYSIWDRIKAKIKQFLKEHFFSNITDNHVKIVLWIIVAIVVIIISLLLFFFKPSLFFRNKKKKVSFSIEDENIHALNFEELIKNSLQSEEYTMAIRWEYLRLLKILHRKNLISWDPHKTVNEYVKEVKQMKIKEDFKKASHEFLYYRYGNFEASQKDWETFVILIQQIIKQI